MHSTKYILPKAVICLDVECMFSNICSFSVKVLLMDAWIVWMYGGMDVARYGMYG